MAAQPRGALAPTPPRSCRRGLPLVSAHFGVLEPEVTIAYNHLVGGWLGGVKRVWPRARGTQPSSLTTTKRVHQPLPEGELQKSGWGF